MYLYAIYTIADFILTEIAQKQEAAKITCMKNVLIPQRKNRLKK